MDLLHNPFYILGVSPVDGREKLHDAAEERSLFDDPEECTAALDALINPRKRLEAEMSWFTKNDPNLILEALNALKNSSGSIKNHPDTPPLDRANVMASIIAATPKVSPETLARFIEKLGDYFDRIKENDLLLRINENRTQSGFPMVSINLVQEEMQERRRWFRQVLRDALDRLLPMDLVRTIALTVESSTDNGRKHAPLLVDDLLDSYELEAQPFFDREKRNIEKILEQLKNAAREKRPEQVLLDMAEDLKRVLNNWNLLIKPIRTGMKARGLPHSASEQMCLGIRSVSVDMFNMHRLLRISIELNRVLCEVFSDAPNMLERLEKDAKDLSEQEKAKGARDAKISLLVIILILFALYIFLK